MAKAKYIGKTYDRDFVYLEYEYRGRRYEVYENRSKGNEPLSWQHKNNQGNIDAQIELEEKMAALPESQKETVNESLDRFFRYLDGDETAFDE